VYIVGMTEARRCPPGRLLPDAGEDPLACASGQRWAERQAFSTAVAAADGGQLTQVP
jgi:hypothetical protein